MNLLKKLIIWNNNGSLLTTLLSFELNHVNIFACTVLLKKKWFCKFPVTNLISLIKVKELHKNQCHSFRTSLHSWICLNNCNGLIHLGLFVLMQLLENCEMTVIILYLSRCDIKSRFSGELADEESSTGSRWIAILQFICYSYQQPSAYTVAFVLIGHVSESCYQFGQACWPSISIPFLSDDFTSFFSDPDLSSLFLNSHVCACISPSHLSLEMWMSLYSPF